MFGHRHETERLIGDHLMVEERAFARFVKGTQRTEVGRFDPDLLARMNSQDLWHILVSIGYVVYYLTRAR